MNAGNYTCELHHYHQYFFIGVDGDGLPDLLPNQVYIETYDSSTFIGIARYITSASIPSWMKPSETPITHQFHYVYIQTQKSYIHYVTQAPLILKNVGNGHYPAHNLPIFADVRIGNENYMTSKAFEISDPNHPPRHMEPHTRIYITVPEDPIFSAVLKTRPLPKKRNLFGFRS